MRRLVFLALGFLLMGYVFTLVRDAGVFRTIHSHYFLDERGVRKCRTIPNVPGPEDLARIGSTGVIISSAPFPRLADAPEGALYYVDLASPALPPLKLAAAYPPGFHPHGLDAYPTVGGAYRVAVVNHAFTGTKEEDEIDFFNFDPKGPSLVYEKKVSDPLLGTSTNDLVLTGVDRFYATVDHAGTTHLEKTAEDFLRIGLGYLVYFNGKRIAEAYRGITFANGIIRLPRSGDLIVASMLAKKVLRFAETAPGAIELKGETHLDAAPDNLFFEPETHALWIGAHPKLLKLKGASKNASSLSPAMALRIADFDGPRPAPVEEVFADTGEHFSALSTAMTQAGQLVFGAVYGDRLLVCPLAKGIGVGPSGR